MKEKKLIVKFHKGITYEIPARVIAEDRARYYADVDGYEEDSQEFLDEVNSALYNEYEIFDWVENNMNWSDLQPYAQKISDDLFDIEEEWTEGNRTLSLN
jgi:hypothetical protein